MQIPKEEEQDVKPLTRCEERRKEWATHWQGDMKVQDLKNTPRRNEELKNLEAGMPRLLEKAAKSCKAKTGVVCDGFHPNVPLDLTKETRGKVVEFLEKVEQCGRWQQACTRMFFLSPNSVTTERPIALMPEMVRWCEALRAPEVAKWQHKYRFEWDTTDGRNGGAERTVWETLLEMKRFTYHAGERDQGATALVLDFAKAFERVSLCGLGQGISTFPKTNHVCYAGTSNTNGGCSSKVVWRRRSRP